MKKFDYSNDGLYFVTICTKNHLNYFWAAPTISTVVQQMNGYVSKKTGFSVWQKLFNGHII